MYTIIRKRQVFYQLANLPSDHAAIAKALSGRKSKAGGQPGAPDATAAKNSQPVVLPAVTPGEEEEPKKEEIPIMEGNGVTGIDGICDLL